MPVQKLSIALDEDLAQEARQSAAREGTTVSAWLARAARNALLLERGRRAVAVWEKENGAFTAKELREAGDALDRARRRTRRR